MAVREFNGSTDVLDCGIGALSGMTHGTVAAMVNMAGAATHRAIAHLHNSGGSFVGSALYVRDSNTWTMNDGGSDSSSAATATVGVWFLVVARKATGTSVVRFSIYNMETPGWTHQNGSTLANWTAPGAGGSVRFRFDAGGDEFNGMVAVRAAWSNALPWTADASGDTAIEAAGLEDALQSWVTAAPGALWAFNQASVATPVPDIMGGGADQTSITGTTVVTTDDPPGFDFSLGGPVVSYSRPILPGRINPDRRVYLPGRWPGPPDSGFAVSAVDLVVQDLAQDQTTDSPAFTQTHELVVQDLAQTQATDSPALTQVHVLVVADTAQSQTLDTPTITLVTNLVVQDLAQSQISDSPALTQVHVLTVQDASQGQITDTPTLAQVHNLSVQDAFQGQTLDNVTIALVTTLVVQDALQSQTTDSPTITQLHVLASQDAFQGQTTDTPVLIQVHNLTVSAALQGQITDTPTITLLGIDLVVADLAQTQTLDSPTFTQLHVLVVDAALQGHTLDNVTIGVTLDSTPDVLLLSSLTDPLTLTSLNGVSTLSSLHAPPLTLASIPDRLTLNFIQGD